MTLSATPDHADDLTRVLLSRYEGRATVSDVSPCVATALDAIAYVGAGHDEEMLDIARTVAERELRLRLGLDREVARLDPEDHRRDKG